MPLGRRTGVPSRRLLAATFVGCKRYRTLIEIVVKNAPGG
jgi:hypothetical protein